jgi:serine/threonine protein kinase
MEDFVKSLPANFETCGESIYKARNEVKVIYDGDDCLVAKSFKIPHLINKIAYSFLRPSKARRSYLNALELINNNVNTPVPIACIEERKCGLFARSYYISSYIQGQSTLRDVHYCTLDQVKELAAAFALYTACIHHRRILHRDYSLGNILYEKIDGLYHFSLVDINRMRFGKEVGLRAAAFGFRKLWDNDDVALYIAGIYARERGFDEETFKAALLKYRRRFWKKP